MGISNDISLPNLVFNVIIWSILITIKIWVLFRIKGMQKEIDGLEKRIEELPSAVIGALFMREEFREWLAQYTKLEGKLELMERRIDKLYDGRDEPD